MKVEPLYDDVETTPADYYFKHYANEFERQPVALLLDLRDGTMWIEVDHNVGNGVPADIYFGRVLRFNVPEVPTPAGANKLLDRVAPMAQAILDDDGETEGASPGAVLCDYLDNGAELDDADLVSIWTDEAITDDWVDAADMSGDMDDEAVAKVEASILANLAFDNGSPVAVCPGLLEWLLDHRDRLRAAAAEAAETETIGAV